ncbi:hypothetical protein HYN56_18530 [Flavobacterium crocinum]|uniref:Lipoprotein n=1 Tax=Flavobacterium crocinum TaxID=2183896 RepID=A0A2S1YPY6_9FLAO|nr:hypothetical protein [Flavobacterium crocinum]AWK06116.1 hypothetical protein HYN56_18530 [Flavobacterium crocinum]
MKNIFTLFLLLFLASCVNDNDGTTQKLPSITTEGKNTFGCKTDGETFLPKSSGGFSAGYKTPILSAKYYESKKIIGSEIKSDYNLVILAINELTHKNIYITSLNNDKPIEEGKIYPITIEKNSLFHAEYSCPKSSASPFDIYTFKTTEDYSGELKINKIDEVNLIISGTFFFDSIDSFNNKTAEIRDGRFDIKYTPYD